MDEHGHGRFVDGGEIVDRCGGCFGGRQHGEEIWLRSAPASCRVGSGTREKWSSKDG
jgi:hypothetical protein